MGQVDSFSGQTNIFDNMHLFLLFHSKNDIACEKISKYFN